MPIDTDTEYSYIEPSSPEAENTRRALEAHIASQQRHALQSHPQAGDNNTVHVIGRMFAEARHAVGYTHRAPAGFDDAQTHTIRKVAAVTGTLNLNRNSLSSLFNSEGQLIRTPSAKLAASSIALSTGILAASRVAAAGVHLIIRPDPTRAIPTGRTGDVALQRNTASFRTLSAAEFAAVEDGADVGTIPHPVLSAELDWETSETKGVRMVFKRAEQRALEGDLLFAEIEAALVLGLARAADATLLDAIAMAPILPFSLAAAAAQGLKFNELKGLVGTEGTGAAIAQDGALRVAGIGAQLTADMIGTVVGAWDRAAVAIHEDIPLHYERLNVAGDLVVTAFVDLIPLVPDATKFWSIEA